MVFETFNDPARRAVYLSQEAARQFGHPWIGTSHLLIGVLCKQEKGESLPAIVGQLIGLSYDDVCRQTAETLGDRGPGPDGHIKFTDRTKHVITAAVRASQAQGSPVVHTGHLLLGFTDPRTKDPEPVRRQSRLMRKALDGSPDFYDIARRLIMNATTLEALRLAVFKVIEDQTSTIAAVSDHG